MATVSTQHTLQLPASRLSCWTGEDHRTTLYQVADHC